MKRPGGRSCHPWVRRVARSGTQACQRRPGTSRRCRPTNARRIRRAGRPGQTGQSSYWNGVVRMRARTLGRVGVLAAGVAAAVLVVAGPAAAHVTVNPSNATQGGFAKLTFRVPNEKDDATTTTLEVNLP